MSGPSGSIAGAGNYARLLNAPWPSGTGHRSTTTTIVVVIGVVIVVRLIVIPVHIATEVVEAVGRVEYSRARNVGVAVEVRVVKPTVGERVRRVCITAQRSVISLGEHIRSLKAPFIKRIDRRVLIELGNLGPIGG